MILYYRDEMAVRDIARALGVTTGTIKTLLFRARRHLRERLGAATHSSRGDIDMTCTARARSHRCGAVRGLSPRAPRRRRGRHARHCATCGPAMKAAAALTTDLPRCRNRRRRRIWRRSSWRASHGWNRSPRFCRGDASHRGRLRVHVTGRRGRPQGGLAAGIAIVLLTPLGDAASIDVPLPDPRDNDCPGRLADDDHGGAGARLRPRALRRRAVRAARRQTPVMRRDFGAVLNVCWVGRQWTPGRSATHNGNVAIRIPTRLAATCRSVPERAAWLARLPAILRDLETAMVAHARGAIRRRRRELRVGGAGGARQRDLRGAQARHAAHGGRAGDRRPALLER